MKLNRVNIFFIISAFLTLLVFAWWTKLLLTKNEESWEFKIKIFRLEQKIENNQISDKNLEKLPEVAELRRAWHQQQNWILFEGSMFLIALLFGIWKIREAISREYEINFSRQNFMFSVTHELKSPVAAISLALQTLNRREFDVSHRQELTRNALEDVERLNMLVDNILLAAQLNNNYAPHFEPFEITKTINDIIDSYAKKFPDAQIIFESTVLPRLFNGDKQGIYSVFSNLIENAIKYSDAHSVIKLKAQYANEKLICDVVDSGVGIPENERKKIFDRFYRIGNELTRKSKGTGLGLYIVSEIVRRHRGTIRVLDNYPRGTIFRVSLPNRLELKTESN